MAQYPFCNLKTFKNHRLLAPIEPPFHVYAFDVVSWPERVQYWFTTKGGRFLPYSVRSPYVQFLSDGSDSLIFQSEPVRDSQKLVDFGAFTGHSTSEVLGATKAEILAVEPLPHYAEVLENRFGNEPRVTVLAAILGLQEGHDELFVEGDRSGAWAKGNAQPVRVAPVALLDDFLDSHNSVALINIEGGEYSLLELLDATNLLKRFSSIFVQFHRISDLGDSDRNLAQQRLLKTHDPIWAYPFVWERWDRRASDEPKPLDSTPWHE